MEIILEKETEYPKGFIESEINPMELFEKITQQILLSLNIDPKLSDTEVSVTLTDNESIREINREYRNIDSPTDVLSFPMMEYESPLVPVAESDFESEEAILGDIVISMERLIEQAEEYGHSKKRELAFLFTHGMLHLLGFDHIEEDERLVMEDKQRLILEELGITR